MHPAATSAFGGGSNHDVRARWTGCGLDAERQFGVALARAERHLGALTNSGGAALLRGVRETSGLSAVSVDGC